MSKKWFRPMVEVLEDRNLLANLAANINPGAGDSSPQELTVFGNALLFSANNGQNGEEPFYYTPGAPNAALMANIALDGGIQQGSNPFGYTRLPGANPVGVAFFASNFFQPQQDRRGYELYIGNNNVLGTQPLVDINPGEGDAVTEATFQGFTALGNYLYFAAYNGTKASLYRTDGTLNGTGEVANFPANLSQVQYIAAAGTNLYFSGNTPAGGTQLWKYDTMNNMATAIPGVSSPRNLTIAGNYLYFTAAPAAEPPTERDLYSYDLGNGNILSVADIPNSDPDRLFAVGNRLIFTAIVGGTVRKLWSVSGPGTLQLLGNIQVSSQKFMLIDNIVYFTGSRVDGSNMELWRTDGTPAGTWSVIDIRANGGSRPINFAKIGNTLYFSASESIFDGYRLWRSNGTRFGTEKVDDTNNPVSGPNYIVQLGNNLYFSGAGKDINNIDVGNELFWLPLPPTGVRGQVWLDADRNGLQDILDGVNTEAGMENVLVELFQSGASTPYAFTYSDAEGYYSFTDVEPGDYYVKFTNPNGFTFSPQVSGDPFVNSDVNSLGETNVFTLALGDDVPVDAGIYGLNIGNFVWEDLDGDGLQGASEPGIAGVTVYLHDSQFTQIDSAVTDANGHYLFTGLPPGTYYVFFILPVDYWPTLVDAGTDDSLDNDFGPYGYEYITVTLSGSDDLSIDAGLVPPTTVTRRIFQDDDEDGIQDAGEMGMSDLWVYLYTSTGTLVASAQTDFNGTYLIQANLASGDYYLVFSSTASFEFTAQDQGSDDTLDSDANASGITALFSLLAGEEKDDLDAGLVYVA